jgi:hypothetical protein
LIIREAWNDVPVDLQQCVASPVGFKAQRVAVLWAVDLDHATPAATTPRPPTGIETSATGPSRRDRAILLRDYDHWLRQFIA